MKVQFVFNGRKYIAESKNEAYKFISYWDGFFSRAHRFQSNWKIKGVELAPGWGQFIQVDMEDKIGYK